MFYVYNVLFTSNISVHVQITMLVSSSLQGVIFDECLTLDAHISNICRRAHFHLRNIGRIRMLLSFEASSQLIHVLITTTLDYCNGILFNLPKNKIERLQRIQNQAARMLKRIPRRNHITPVLKDLHWLRINKRIEFKILILTHRAFYETGPRYLSELIKKHNSSNRTRRANDHCLLSIPPISKMCANSYFERSFSYAAPFLWNRLDMSIRMLDFDHFKSRIKTELYLRYFEA